MPPSCIAPNNLGYSDNPSPNISPSSEVHQQQYLRGNNSNPSSHNNDQQQHTLMEHPGPAYPLSQHLQRY